LKAGALGELVAAAGQGRKSSRLAGEDAVPEAAAVAAAIASAAAAATAESAAAAAAAKAKADARPTITVMVRKMAAHHGKAFGVGSYTRPLLTSTCTVLVTQSSKPPNVIL